MRYIVRFSKGFTWIELLITLIIIGVLAALAIPSFKDYKSRAYFNDIVQIVTPYRVAVAECIQHTRQIKGCNAETHKIPAAVKTPKGPIASLQVVDGVITVIPVPAQGITAAETYVLTPSLNESGDIVWKTSGGSVTAGYTK